MVDVAAAVLVRADGAFLLARRPAGKVYAGWWEFPGGKVEAGEAAAAALARELQEELGIVVRRAAPWITRVFAYAHATVRLHFFRVFAWDGTPHPREGQALAWQVPGAPGIEPMLPANAPVLDALGLPGEYAIADAGTSLESVQARLDAGLRLLRVRGARAQDSAFVETVCRAARAAGARVIGPPGAGLDGEHFDAASLCALTERPSVSLCGASVHTRDEIEHAMRLGLDFLVLGPVLPTASHPGAPTLGWEGFERLVAGTSLPVYAIGGLQPHMFARAQDAGAHGIAMIRGSWAAQLPRGGGSSASGAASTATR